MRGKFASEETTKTALLKEKAKVEGTMDKLKKEFDIEKISLDVAKVEAETSLKAIEKDLSITEKAFSKNFTVRVGWKENCSHRNDLIADMCLKLGDSFSAQQNAQLGPLTQQHNLSFNLIIEKSTKRHDILLKKSMTSPSKPTDGSITKVVGQSG